jgi:hypothetical protein
MTCVMQTQSSIIIEDKGLWIRKTLLKIVKNRVRGEKDFVTFS